ncbi:unnamed protein product [Owenia fusiformis]|uniref:Uncharacterized protein n=1 Tax=Owenia fusiformis TaxID=6347 RepID=A0A8J1XLU3_OWEFU|nr:unnamed protein product [Owenia fusiformis]
MYNIFPISVCILSMAYYVDGGTDEVGGNKEDTAIVIKAFGKNRPNVAPIRQIRDDKFDADPAFPDICADIEVVLDYSCSLSRKTRDLARNASKAIGYHLLDYDPSLLRTRFGIITYGDLVTRVKNLDEDANAFELVARFDEIDVKRKQGPNCRTHTHLALQEVQNSFKKYERTDVQQIILLFTDGLTFKRRNRASMYIAADRLKTSGVIIYTIQLPHKQGKFQEQEYLRVPHSENHLFNGTDIEITNLIVSQMRIDAPCLV